MNSNKVMLPEKLKIAKFLHNAYQNFTRNSFVKNVLVLLSGTAIAQGIGIAVIPVLSRLYDPEAFGTLALYTSTAGIFVTVACWRYELAIVLPEKKSDAASIMVMTLLIVLIMTCISAVTILFGRFWIANLLDAPKMAAWLWWIPFSVFAGGVCNFLKYWSVRNKQFKLISVSSLCQSISKAGTQTWGGVANIGIIGLIGGHLIGSFFGMLILTYNVIRNDKSIFLEAFKEEKIKKVATTYIDFPKYSCYTSLLNSFSLSMPVYIFSFYWGSASVGLFSLANSLIQIPANLIGNSVRQVFLQKASEMYRNGGDIYSLLRKTMIGLFMIMIVPVILVSIIGPAMFSLVLGETWVTAGIYARWLIVSSFIGFLCIPSIELTRIMGLQKQLSYYIMLLFVSRLSVLILAGKSFDARTGIIFYSVTGIILNTLLIAIMLSKTKRLMYCAEFRKQ